MYTAEFLEMGKIAAESAIETLIRKAKEETGKTVGFDDVLNIIKTDEATNAMYTKLVMTGMKIQTGMMS